MKPTLPSCTVITLAQLNHIRPALFDNHARNGGMHKRTTSMNSLYFASSDKGKNSFSLSSKSASMITATKNLLCAIVLRIVDSFLQVFCENIVTVIFSIYCSAHDKSLY